MYVESRFSKRVQKYKKTATVLMLKNWKYLLSHYRRVLAKASFILLYFPPHKWDGNELSRFIFNFIAVGFSQRLK